MSERTGGGPFAHRRGSVSDTFPRQYARTQRFTLGEPRNLEVSADGQRVVFLRSAGGSDPVTSLWVLDVATGEERIVADARHVVRWCRRRQRTATR